jgi:hypothetical protein
MWRRESSLFYRGSNPNPSIVLHVSSHYADLRFLLLLFLANISKMSGSTAVVYLLGQMTKDNVQNCDSYIIIPSSQTYR